jgi:broad specificity phosphatase PhoE
MSAPPASTKKNLWLIRHAESMHNAKDKYAATHKTEEDFANTRLSDTGKLQAAKVHGPVELLIVSPLRRTLETYALSNLQCKRLITSDLFREFRAYGPACHFELEPRTVETVDEFQKRVRQALTFLAEQPEPNIGVLSHGVTIGEICRQLGKPLQHGIANAQVIHLENVAIARAQ